ncbi:MAG: hypothetical protein Q8867_03875 [Bacteroidota bacterium]|nr:hypothetical protein [Bacteroidota bacterium]
MLINRNISVPLFIFIFFSCFIFSCRKEDKIDTSPAYKLTFSTDTVYFDTIFSTIGSVTQQLRVFNNNNHKLNISSIRLAGGESSNFRVNINGNSSLYVTNVEIPAHDSIFIFVKVTVDPKNKNLPFIVSDSLLFMTNGNQQTIKLVAWGQDAIFHKKEVLKGSVTWDSTLPHVIYGPLRVDTSANLTIMPGTKIYFHKSSYLVVSKDATLKILGNLDHPVRLQGDRLDPYYCDLPGQWDGILLEKGSKDDEIDYAIIKNGNWGIEIDSSTSNNPMLKLDNTIIQNITNSGLYAYATSITSTNCVISNCGASALALTFGGSYDFRQLTIGNYWVNSVRLGKSLYLSNYTYDNYGNKKYNPMNNAFFGNCIIYGNDDEEIQYDTVPSVGFQHVLDHCLLKTQLRLTNTQYYPGSFANKEPGFVNPDNYDLRIDSTSAAIGKGVNRGVLYDLKGIQRPDPPSLGAYEYVKTR